MEVILREDISKLGRRGDVVKVAEGYGRNYLLPRGLAMAVTAANRAVIERERKAHDARTAKEKAECEGLAAGLAGLRYVVARKAGENDLLYGSVTSGDIAEYLEAKGIAVDKRRILLDEPIKRLGEYDVKIRLHPEVVPTIKVEVVKAE
ncbi:MAG: 50S ribosomal protein L9 [Vicinamibacteria bacterium]|nr:50S ribosomal protein L9 [Vicinamibacteria bacterium]